MDINEIKKDLDNKKPHLTVKDLKEFIADLPDNMKVYIVSDNEMPVRKLVDIESDERTGYYSELYLNTVER